MPMDVCHVLLGRPWKFDRKVIHDGNRNYYKFKMGGIHNTISPLQEGNGARVSKPQALLIAGK